MIKNLSAKLISQDLLDYLRDNQGGIAKVLSVYPNAVNLLADNKVLITLATSRHSIMPMSMVVQETQDLRSLFKSGDEFRVDQAELVGINSNVKIGSHGVLIWDPDPLIIGTLRTRTTIEQVQNELVSWLNDQPQIGLLPQISKLFAHRLQLDDDIQDAYSRYIAKDLTAFVEALLNSDWQLALDIACGLVGLGMGSTPSCDDFLVAYLVIFDICRRMDPDNFGWVGQFGSGIVALAQTRTTLISAHMLEHAAVGKVSRNYQALIHACLFDSDFDFEKLVSDVGATGASSGMDFLVGLCCTLEWFGQHGINNKSKGGMEQVAIDHLQPVTIA